MKAKPINRTGLQIVFALLWFLSAQNVSSAKLIFIPDPRLGVLDARLIVLVKEQEKDLFTIEEVYLGERQAGDKIHLPAFKLIIERQEEPDIIEPVTSDTRILLFLQPRKDDFFSWEISGYGRCYFWVQDPAKVDELRKKATDAIALRRDWETARDLADEHKRVEALWPYLWNNNRYFRGHTTAELKKIGTVAGDYIAQKFETLDRNQRSSFILELGEYGSRNAHDMLLLYLKKSQEKYQQFLMKQGESSETFIDHWDKAPDEIKDVYGELFYGTEGLATFKDRSDLVYIRELAGWAIKYRFKQVCDAALRAFQEMPEKANLPVIDAIWGEFSVRPYEGNQLHPSYVVRSLVTHKYPEAIPSLVPFLKDNFMGEEAQDALVEIVGMDLGKAPKPWLDWYANYKKKK
jgi:hypothetical protein